MVAIVVIALVGIASLFMPIPAFADEGWDPIGDLVRGTIGQIAKGINSFLVGICKDLLSFFDGISGGGFITASFIGSDNKGINAIYGFMSQINNGIAKPLALTFFSLIVVFDLYNNAVIGEKMNMGLPGVEVVFKTLLKAIVVYIVIINCFTWMSQLFDGGQYVTGLIQNVFLGAEDTDWGGTAGGSNPWSAWEESTDFGTIFPLIILMMMILAEVLVVNAVGLLRLVTGAIYLSMSPIAIVTLANDETKQIGIGYLRSFLALVIQGFILMIVVGLLPAFTGTFLIDSGMLSVTPTGALVALFNMLSVFISSIVVIFLTFKSSTYARQIVGL